MTDQNGMSSATFAPLVPSFEKWALGVLAHAHGSHADWTGRMFTQDALTMLAHTFEDLEPDEPFDTPLHQRRPRVTRVLRASWDGAVALSASFTSRALHEDPPKFETLLEPVWWATDDLVRQLGGYGPARLTVTVRVGRPSTMRSYIGDQPDPPPDGSLFALLREGDVVMKRAVSVGEVAGAQIASLSRELQRAAGKAVYEPGDEGEAETM